MKYIRILSAFIVFTIIGITSEIEPTKSSHKIQTKGVGHVGGFAVSGRVSTIANPNTQTDTNNTKKDIKTKK